MNTAHAPVIVQSFKVGRSVQLAAQREKEMAALETAIARATFAVVDARCTADGALASVTFRRAVRP